MRGPMFECLEYGIWMLKGTFKLPMDSFNLISKGCLNAIEDVWMSHEHLNAPQGV